MFWLGIALLLLTSAGAQAQSDQAEIITRIQKTLQTRLPEIGVIEKVQPSQWPYFYEVITASEMFYVDANADFLFYGKVLDTKTHDNVTDRRWNSLLQVDFSTLPFDLALKQVKGDGSRKLVVFADAHCPYCVRFEKTLQEVDNVTVYTFLYPLESIHPGSTEKTRQIWCSTDRLTAWHEWMLNKKDLPATNCNSESLAILKKLGDKLKVTGTPTLIFEDGHRVPGAIGKDDLEKQFKAVTKKS